MSAIRSLRQPEEDSVDSENLATLIRVALKSSGQERADAISILRARGVDLKKYGLDDAEAAKSEAKTEATVSGGESKSSEETQGAFSELFDRLVEGSPRSEAKLAATAGASPAATAAAPKSEEEQRVASGRGVASEGRPSFTDYVSDRTVLSGKEDLSGVRRNVEAQSGRFTPDWKELLSSPIDRSVSAQSVSSGPNDAMFAELEAKYGLPSGYLANTYRLESTSGKDLSKSSAGAEGHFQFIPSTAQQYGLKNPNDLRESAEAAAKLGADNKAALTKSLGREPTSGELYLAHQQGGGGAGKLLSSPNTKAADLVGLEAVRQNLPDSMKSQAATITAGDLAKFWNGEHSRGGTAAVAVSPNAKLMAASQTFEPQAYPSGGFSKSPIALGAEHPTSVKTQAAPGSRTTATVPTFANERDKALYEGGIGLYKKEGLGGIAARSGAAIRDTFASGLTPQKLIESDIPLSSKISLAKTYAATMQPGGFVNPAKGLTPEEVASSKAKHQQNLTEAKPVGENLFGLMQQEVDKTRGQLAAQREGPSEQPFTWSPNVTTVEARPQGADSGFLDLLEPKAAQDTVGMFGFGDYDTGTEAQSPPTVRGVTTESTTVPEVDPLAAYGQEAEGKALDYSPLGDYLDEEASTVEGTSSQVAESSQSAAPVSESAYFADDNGATYETIATDANNATSDASAESSLEQLFEQLVSEDEEEEEEAS